MILLNTVIKVIIRSAIVIFLGYGLILFLMQDSMLYMPGSYDVLDVDNAKSMGLEPLEFTTSQGKQTAFYMPPIDDSKPPEKVWIVCGGNGARALDYIDTVQNWNNRWGFLFIDFPGYGLCEGNPTPARIRENTTGAIETLGEKLSWDRAELEKRMNAFGHSIGAAAVLQAAADFKMERSVVVAPFTSTLEMAKAQVGAPFHYVLRHRFDNRKSLEQIRDQGGKVTIFHGEADRIVPMSMGETLAKEFPETVTFLAVKNGDHNAIVRNIMEGLKVAANGEK